MQTAQPYRLTTNNSKTSSICALAAHGPQTIMVPCPLSSQTPTWLSPCGQSSI